MGCCGDDPPPAKAQQQRPVAMGQPQPGQVQAHQPGQQPPMSLPGHAPSGQQPQTQYPPQVAYSNGHHPPPQPQQFSVAQHPNRASYHLSMHSPPQQQQMGQYHQHGQWGPPPPSAVPQHQQPPAMPHHPLAHLPQGQQQWAHAHPGAVAFQGQNGAGLPKPAPVYGAPSMAAGGGSPSAAASGIEHWRASVPPSTPGLTSSSSPPPPTTSNNTPYSNGNGNGYSSPPSTAWSPPQQHQPQQQQQGPQGQGQTAQVGAAELLASQFEPYDPPGLEDEGRLSVGIDFGTTFSGASFASRRFAGGQVQCILQWPGSYETFRKTPTCILYSQSSPHSPASIVSWGLEAKNTTPTVGLIKCEWFKLFLTPEALLEGRADPRLPALPVGKTPEDVVVDYLTCLWSYAKGKITEALGSVADLNSADVVLTVPAAWDAQGCAIMREAAIKAGMVQSSRAGDKNWRDRLRIITEPEAAAIQASTLQMVHQLRPPATFLICDAGGGTVDCASYKLLGQLDQLEIAELCSRTGKNCGSLFVDLRFEALLREVLKNHPVHLEPRSMATFMHAFSETDKLAYHGTEADDHSLFRFNLFNLEDNYDPQIGLEHGELAIPGFVLKRDVFEPIIKEVVELIEAQIAKIPRGTSVDALILVGGFSSSEYLFTRVKQTFGEMIRTIARPQDCDIATLKGASRYGLGLAAGKLAVASVISPRSYIMKVKLPAEPIDIQCRPGYISRNAAGIQVCENRLSYLVAAGAVLKKGQVLRSRFCKYSRSPQDCLFTAVLYVSERPQIFRWTDEGETRELCRWTVDLSQLPNFAAATMTGGSYIEFDLGLILDSAEVQGVLLSEEGLECGRAVFEYLK